MNITVQCGDTLWSLAAAHLGSGQHWREIYKANAATIHQEQKRFPDARAAMTGPDWIFPGTVLAIPGVDGQ
jgi:nucleoid-associated protein YgaU